MPLQLEILGPARRDLIRITAYIARQNKDWDIATRFGRQMVERCCALTSAPGAGAPTVFGADIRKVVEGAYKIYYRVDGTKLFILRIWDGRRGSEPRL